MSERLLDKLYIGIDLKEESAMLSYFHPGMERPATVSFVAEALNTVCHWWLQNAMVSDNGFTVKMQSV